MRPSRLAAFVAIAAMLLQGLWPLIAQAKPRAASTLVPVCTVDGVTHYIELRTERAPANERTSSHVDHCALCMLGADRIALPSSDVLQIEDRVDAIRSGFESTPFLPLVVVSARSRAPPAAMFVNRNINGHGEWNDKASNSGIAGRCAGDPA